MVRAMSEMTERFERAAGGFDQTIRSVPSDKWGAPSPCERWTARDVVGHVVRNYRTMATQGGGGEAPGTGTAEMGVDEDPVEAWTAAYHRMQTLTRDPEALARPVPGPGGTVPLEQAMGTLISMDTNVHKWDLARAAGVDETLDPELVQMTRQMLEPMDAMIRRDGVFGPKLDPPPGADEQTSLLYFLGRRA